MLKVKVYDEFLKLTMTGIFDNEQEAREFYAFENGTTPEEVKIIEQEEI